MNVLCLLTATQIDVACFVTVQLFGSLTVLGISKGLFFCFLQSESEVTAEELHVHRKQAFSQKN